MKVFSRFYEKYPGLFVSQNSQCDLKMQHLLDFPSISYWLLNEKKHTYPGICGTSHFFCISTTPLSVYAEPPSLDLQSLDFWSVKTSFENMTKTKNMAHKHKCNTVSLSENEANKVELRNKPRWYCRIGLWWKSAQSADIQINKLFR